MNEKDIVIVAAARTPIGSFIGSLSSVPAHYLGQVAIKAAMTRAGIEPKEVDEVILGQTLTAAQGQNPARQASIGVGIAVDTPAWGIEPGLRLWLARRRRRGAANRAQERRHRDRRRPREHEPGAARRASSERRQDGQS